MNCRGTGKDSTTFTYTVVNWPISQLNFPTDYRGLAALPNITLTTCMLKYLVTISLEDIPSIKLWSLIYILVVLTVLDLTIHACSVTLAYQSSVQETGILKSVQRSTWRTTKESIFVSNYNCLHLRSDVYFLWDPQLIVETGVNLDAASIWGNIVIMIW